MLVYVGNARWAVGGNVDYVEGLRLDASKLLAMDYVGSFTLMVPHAFAFVELYIITHDDDAFVNELCCGIVVWFQNSDYV